jgi:uncharacterized protein
MIALDTNFLIHAHRMDSPHHAVAYAKVKVLMQGTVPWGIPNPCISEFLNIATHPKIYQTPTPIAQALAQIDAWLESPVGSILHSGESFWPTLKSIAQSAQLRGAQYHDARIAAVCLENSFTTIWTVDRDFSRYKHLKAINPIL